jgi:hypothetical protein
VPGITARPDTAGFFPDGTVTDAEAPDAAVVVPVPDAIRPEPCAGTDGSCSSSYAR